jgi:hypothetical protein
MTGQKINDEATVQVNLRWFIQIMAVVAIAVWGYFGLTERITMLEHTMGIAEIQVDMNSEFRTKWPRGELGALPADASQDMRLDMAEKIMDKLEERLDDLDKDLQDLKHRRS